MQLLELEGTPTEIGIQHGRQVQHLRPLLLRTVEARLGELRLLGADLPAVLAPARAALESHDRPLLDFLAALAAALDLSPDALLTYTLSSYLHDLYKVTHPMPPIAEQLRDGCTAWAASAPTTAGGAALLAKNRDYRLDHIPLQLLCQVKPHAGYRYLSVGSAGSPHVFSSGINERGLAIADTHVLSSDIGPGLPRFSLMREVLQHHATTHSALEYLRSVPHMGAGTLILADACGHLAVCESGHSRCGYVEAGATGADGAGRAAYLATANHFVTPELAGHWVEDEPPMLQGNSAGRRDRVLAALAAAPGQVDATWARALMCAHGSPQDALCRHALIPDDRPPTPRFAGSTISSVVYLPCGLPGDASAAPIVWLADGQPCLVEWQSSRVG